MLISGGQTGVDRAALDFALAVGIKCSGWCPRGRKAEDGQIPEKYPLIEASSDLYQQRTRKNVKDSDATLIVTNGSASRGTELTIKFANNYFKPIFVLSKADSEQTLKLLHWLHRIEPGVLNVAGPRGSESSDVYRITAAALSACIMPSLTSEMNWPPTRPYTRNLNFAR